MRKNQKIFDDICQQLIAIRLHGGHLDQYDTVLYALFVESYKSKGMLFESEPRLTAEAIVDRLCSDKAFLSTNIQSDYLLLKEFSIKWCLWTDAFNKGFEGGYIQWA